MTYFPLRQTTCFFIPLVAPCKPLLTFFKLSQICDVSHSTLKNSERRGGQLSVDTIERICDGLGITMSEFFARKG